jgi:hypothetical protein
MDKPTNIKEINQKYIGEYVSEQGQAAIDWLNELLEKEVPANKKGERRQISFIEVRNEFVRKYMPEIMPKAKPKEPSMKEYFASLKPKSKK